MDLAVCMLSLVIVEVLCVVEVRGLWMLRVGYGCQDRLVVSSFMSSLRVVCLYRLTLVLFDSLNYFFSS
jgi:hypothetical protein